VERRIPASHVHRYGHHFAINVNRQFLFEALVFQITVSIPLM
jgi:hypothetical protein